MLSDPQRAGKRGEAHIYPRHLAGVEIRQTPLYVESPR